jgi:hypothetical protein
MILMLLGLPALFALRICKPARIRLAGMRRVAKAT